MNMKNRHEAIMQKLKFVLESIGTQYGCHCAIKRDTLAFGRAMVISVTRESGHTASVFVPAGAIDIVPSDEFIKKISDKVTDMAVSLVSIDIEAEEEEISDLRNETIKSSISNYGNWG